jgi:hypothetical protein
LEVYTPKVKNYRDFALTPGGLALGSSQVGACYRLVTTVPYHVLRPYLSQLGAKLIAGIRRVEREAQPASTERAAIGFVAFCGNDDATALAKPAPGRSDPRRAA